MCDGVSSLRILVRIMALTLLLAESSSAANGINITQNSLGFIFHVPLDVSIAASPKTINPESPSTITGTATIAGTGTPLSGADVTYSINGKKYESGGTTDSSGHYSFTVTSYPSGSFSLWVRIFEYERLDSNMNYYEGRNSVWITVNNIPPNAPAQPQGQSSGYIETSYTYSTSATDSNNGQIKYTFDWGDGSQTTTNFIDSPTLASANHKWTNTGTYNVRAMATDSGGLTSRWSEALLVKIERLPQLNVYPDPPSFKLGTMNAGELASRVFSISNAGSGTLYWSVSDNQPWITINPTSGTNSGTVTINVNTAGLSPGNYSGSITITSNGGTKQGSVSLKVATTPIDPPTITPVTTTPVTLVQIMGVILILAGLLFTALTTIKKDVIIEFGFTERTLKYVGSTGVLLVIIGAYILLKSLG